MNLRAFARDLRACGHSPWVESQRMKAVGALILDRWNHYSPFKWTPDLHIDVTDNQRKWRLPMRMCSEDYSAFREIFLYGYYEQDVGQPRTILDLGGYCGYSAIAFSARFPQARIAAVEPHPGNFAALTANLKLNNLPVASFQAAATVADGPVRLFLGGDMTHGLTPNKFSTGDSIMVDGLSIPTVLDRLGWNEIDLLKIDIERSEAILFGARQAWLSHVRTIVGEYHGSYQIPQLRADLEPFGFKVMGLPHRNIFLAARQGSGRSNERIL